MSAKMLKMIADMKAQLAAMEAALTEAAPVAVVEKPKEKRPLSQGLKNWHERCQRLDATLKSHELSFKRVAEAKQFASMIYAKEKVSGMEMRDAQIIEARRAWADEHKVMCVICKTDATEDPGKHGECAAKFILDFISVGRGDKEQGMAEWLKTSGLKAPKSDSEDETPKKAGRPKMSEEQKAAAKAAKAAMTPEEKAAKKAAKAPGAPRKVAWAESSVGGAATGEAKTFEEQLDDAITAL